MFGDVGNAYHEASIEKKAGNKYRGNFPSRRGEIESKTMPNVTKYSRKLCQLLLIQTHIVLHFALWSLTEIVFFTN